jgi:hypothetical protein
LNGLDHAAGDVGVGAAAGCGDEAVDFGFLGAGGVQEQKHSGVPGQIFNSSRSVIGTSLVGANRWFVNDDSQNYGVERASPMIVGTPSGGNHRKANN